jgi:hypothetical protein
MQTRAATAPSCSPRRAFVGAHHSARLQAGRAGFDTRSDAVVDEANAIGTAYLRAQMLPGSTA